MTLSQSRPPGVTPRTTASQVGGGQAGTRRLVRGGGGRAPMGGCISLSSSSRCDIDIARPHMPPSPPARHLWTRTGPGLGYPGPREGPQRQGDPSPSIPRTVCGHGGPAGVIGGGGGRRGARENPPTPSLPPQGRGWTVVGQAMLHEGERTWLPLPERCRAAPAWNRGQRPISGRAGLAPGMSSPPHLWQHGLA